MLAFRNKEEILEADMRAMGAADAADLRSPIDHVATRSHVAAPWLAGGDAADELPDCSRDAGGPWAACLFAKGVTDFTLSVTRCRYAAWRHAREQWRLSMRGGTNVPWQCEHRT